MENKLNLTLPEREGNKKDGNRVVVILIILVLAIGVLNLLYTMRGRGVEGKSALPPRKLMEVALRLEKQGLSEPAAELWKEYLTVSRPGREESAKIWYRIGKLYQEEGRYPHALSAYYLSESFEKASDLEHEISMRTAECLEKMGRFAALGYELERRTSFASTDSLHSDEVVGEIGPLKITRSDLNAMIEAEIENQLTQIAGDLSPDARREQKRKLMDSVLKGDQLRAWLDRLIAEELLYRKAREEKLGEDEDVRRMIDGLERKLLAQKYLEREYGKRIVITPDDLKSYYQAHKDDYKKDGKQLEFNEVRDEIYGKLRMERERDVQRQVIGKLMDEYDVVIHSSKLDPKGDKGEENN